MISKHNYKYTIYRQANTYTVYTTYTTYTVHVWTLTDHLQAVISNLKKKVKGQIFVVT
jgi:hypothetical protein